MTSSIKPVTKEKISERVRLYLNGKEQKWTGFESEARDLNALPILPDLFTVYFLSPDGELFALDLSEEGTQPEIERDIHTKTTVINVASEWFPELKELLSARPGDANDCPDCEGRGRLLITDYYGQPAAIPCPKCMTLGWVQNSAGLG